MASEMKLHFSVTPSGRDRGCRNKDSSQWKTPTSSLTQEDHPVNTCNFQATLARYSFISKYYSVPKFCHPDSIAKTWPLWTRENEKRVKGKNLHPDPCNLLEESDAYRLSFLLHLKLIMGVQGTVKTKVRLVGGSWQHLLTPNKNVHLDFPPGL